MPGKAFVMAFVWSGWLVAAVARTQIEKSGYTGVRGLQRTADGTWHAVARDPRNAPVAVALDGQGKVTLTR